MQHQLRTHAAFFRQKSGQLHCGTGLHAGDGFCRLRQCHRKNFTFHLAWQACIYLPGNVADFELSYRHSCWGITQLADFGDPATNYRLVAIQLTDPV